MDKANRPFFSVIIPSYNRKDDLEALLPHALLVQETQLAKSAVANF